MVRRPPSSGRVRVAMCGRPDVSRRQTLRILRDEVYSCKEIADTIVYESVSPVGVCVHGGEFGRGPPPSKMFAGLHPPSYVCNRRETDASRRRRASTLAGGVSLEVHKTERRHANARRLNASHHPTPALYYTTRDSYTLWRMHAKLSARILSPTRRV